MIKGININPRGNYQPQGETLRNNTDMVRMVFQRWNGSVVQSVEDAFVFYDPLVKQYNAQGIAVLFVLNQQTYGDGTNAPWVGGMSWQQYAKEFGKVCEKIADHYQNNAVTYQVWNEPDITGISSVALTPERYALILQYALLGIRLKSSAKVIGAGLASGAGSQFNYWRSVEREFAGRIPVDYFATHPYGQYLGKTPPAISTGWFGKLDDHMQTVKALGYPIFVTEIGVAEDAPFAEKQYPAIAQYLYETYEYLKPLVSGYIWWAYSDGMRFGGIVNLAQKPKQPIYDMYINLPRKEQPTGNIIRVIAPPTVKINVRSGRGTLYGIVGTAVNGETFQVLDCAEGLRCKQGNTDEWVKVRYDNKVGYINGNFIQVV